MNNINRAGIGEEEVRQRLRDACQPTQYDWGNLHGFPQTYISQVVTGQRPPSPRLLRALGLRKVTRYVEDV